MCLILKLSLMPDFYAWFWFFPRRAKMRRKGFVRRGLAYLYSLRERAAKKPLSPYFLSPRMLFLAFWLVSEVEGVLDASH